MAKKSQTIPLENTREPGKSAQEQKKLFALNTSVPQIREEGFIRFYANRTEVTFTPWDAHITFSEIIENQDDSFQIKQRATVVMSLHHAKAAISMLVQSFANLEKQYGEIKLITSAPEN